MERARQLDRRRGARPAGAPRPQHRHRRRRTAAGRARAGARDQRTRSATPARRSSTPSRSRRAPADQTESLRELVAAMDAGAVEMLVILGGNPVYDAPADLDFADAPGEGRHAHPPTACTTTRPPRCATGTCRRRTTSSPGATRAPTTAPSTIMQPLIAPLYDGQDARTSCSPRCSASRTQTSYDLVRAYWKAHGRTRQRLRGAAGARRVHDGVVAGTALPALRVSWASRRRLGRRPAPPPAAERRTRSRSSSGPTRRSATAASPTTAGCRSCPSRSPSSPGTTPR